MQVQTNKVCILSHLSSWKRHAYWRHSSCVRHTQTSWAGLTLNGNVRCCFVFSCLYNVSRCEFIWKSIHHIYCSSTLSEIQHIAEGGLPTWVERLQASRSGRHLKSSLACDCYHRICWFQNAVHSSPSQYHISFHIFWQMHWHETDLHCTSPVCAKISVLCLENSKLQFLMQPIYISKRIKQSSVTKRDPVSILLEITGQGQHYFIVIWSSLKPPKFHLKIKDSYLKIKHSQATISSIDILMSCLTSGSSGFQMH